MKHKLTLLVRDLPHPLWMSILLKHLTDEGIKWEMLAWKGAAPNEKKIPFFNMHKGLHRIFGHKCEREPFQSYESAGNVPAVHSLEELIFMLKKRNSDFLVNLTGWELPTILEKDLPCKVWSIDGVCWHSHSVDFAYKTWKSVCPYTFSGLFEHSKAGKKLIAYSISPAGKLSFFNCRQAYFSMTGLIIRALRKPEPSQEMDPSIERWTRENIDLFPLFKLGAKTLFEKIRNRFLKPKWVLAFQQIPKTLLIDDAQHREQFSAPKGKEWADPFIISETNGCFIFAEEIDQTGKGRIVVIDPAFPEKSVPLFDHDFHMSYPFVIRDQEELYMIPESSANRTLTLYKATNYPYHWEKVVDIFTDFEVVDTTIIKSGSKWWMFANAKQYASTFNEELHIFHARELVGPWIPHTQNPVKNDARNSRPAGAMRLYGEKIHRPVQDCSWEYGQRIHWMEVEILNESEFNERKIATIEADWASRLTATHTINSDGNYLILDAYTY